MKKKVTMSGEKPDAGLERANAPKPIDPETGQHKDYWILSKEEREKGFLRPVRETYMHKNCGASTRMNVALAETYARDPKFYSKTFCYGCKEHFPVDEFTWKGTEEDVGS